MIIKNLSQLKKAMKDKKEFRILEHYLKPEYKGQIRKPNIVQTNGMYTIVPSDMECKESTCNNGKGTWIKFGMASDWKFDNGICTYIPKFNGVDRPVWSIEVLD